LYNIEYIIYMNIKNMYHMEGQPGQA